MGCCISALSASCGESDPLSSLAASCEAIVSGDTSEPTVSAFTRSMRELVEQHASGRESLDRNDALLVSDAFKIEAAVELIGADKALEAGKRFLPRLEETALTPSGQKLPEPCGRLARVGQGFDRGHG